VSALTAPPQTRPRLFQNIDIIRVPAGYLVYWYGHFHGIPHSDPIDAFLHGARLERSSDADHAAWCASRGIGECP
jgi:hypothetical protein